MNNIVIAEGYAIMRIVEREEQFSPTMKEIAEAFALSWEETELIAKSVIESILGLGDPKLNRPRVDTKRLLELYAITYQGCPKTQLNIWVIPSSLVKSTLEDYFCREVK